MMLKDAKVYVAGHQGLLGSAIVYKLKEEGHSNITVRAHRQLDLTQQLEVEKFFEKEHPQYVILCAARVGGIKANISCPAEFIYENLAIQTNVIHCSHKYGVKKLLFFGSACSYPRQCLQPMKEGYLLSGYLELTNEFYAVAKITGVKMCEAYNRQYGTNFICAIPTNIYGAGDDFDLQSSHVIPALIRKFYEAMIKEVPVVTIWGSGNQRRDFIYADDAADASIFLMHNYDHSEIINVGTGEDISIGELSFLIKNLVGYGGDISFDTSKPDGVSRKLLDVSRLDGLNWKTKTSLEEGIRKTYEWYTKRWGRSHIDKRSRS